MKVVNGMFLVVTSVSPTTSVHWHMDGKRGLVMLTSDGDEKRASGSNRGLLDVRLLESWALLCC
jgi:hypothetical protein